MFRALVCVLLLAPCVARAQDQTCLILPQPTTSTAPSDAHDRATAALIDELRTRGVVVLPASDAQLRMADQSFRDCAAIECAPSVNRFLGTRFAVLAELTWLRGRATMINVVLIGTDESASAGGQTIIERGGDVATAARSAFATAWDRWQADAQAELVLQSIPPGALVTVDGASVGRAPIRQRVTPGAHTIEATLDGYVTQTNDVTIASREERRITFDLVAVSTAAASPPPPEERWENRPHFLNYLIGGGAIALGLGLSVEPIWTAATNGTVYDHGAAGTDTVVFGPESAALTILSGACLIAGVVVLVIAPISERVRVEGTASGLRLRGTF